MSDRAVAERRGSGGGAADPADADAGGTPADLEDLLNQLIAERVIRRHPVVWLVVLTSVMVLILVTALLGGFARRTSDVIQHVAVPYHVDSGRFTYDFTKARIVVEPKSSYDPEKTQVEVAFTAQNTSDTAASISDDQFLLRSTTIPHGEPPSGITCVDEIGYDLVPGLPPVACALTFDVANGFHDTDLGLGVFSEGYDTDNSFVANSDSRSWQIDSALAIVDFGAVPTTRKVSG